MSVTWQINGMESMECDSSLQWENNPPNNSPSLSDLLPPPSLSIYSDSRKRLSAQSGLRSLACTAPWSSPPSPSPKELCFLPASCLCSLWQCSSSSSPARTSSVSSSYPSQQTVIQLPLVCSTICNFLEFDNHRFIPLFWSFGDSKRPPQHWEAAICDRENGGRVRYIRRQVVERRAESAALRRIGVPLHPAAADLPGSREARQGVPVLEVAASRLRLAPLQRHAHAGNSPGEEDDVRRRLLEPRPVHFLGLSPPLRHPTRRLQVDGDKRLLPNFHRKGKIQSLHVHSSYLP